MAVLHILDRVRLELRALVARLRPLMEEVPELAAGYVFGSVARGEAGPASDLDLGLVFRGADRVRRFRAAADLAQRADGIWEGRRVDVVVLEDHGPIFRHRVLRDAVLVYEGDRDRRVDFESDAWVQALDFRPTYEIAAAERIGGLRRWLARRRRDR